MNGRIIAWVIGLVVVAALLLWLLARAFTPTDQWVVSAPTSTNGGVVTSTPSVTSVRVAVLRSLEDEGVTSTRRGCDEVVMVTRTIAPTQAPLTAAMTELFALNEQSVPTGTFSFIDKSNESAPALKRQNLTFDRATIESGTAKVYLKGDVVYAGVCDDPRLRSQIEETALQFTTINKVEIYLNDTLYEDPNGRG